MNPFFYQWQSELRALGSLLEIFNSLFTVLSEMGLICRQTVFVSLERAYYHHCNIINKYFDCIELFLEERDVALFQVTSTIFIS